MKQLEKSLTWFFQRSLIFILQQEVLNFNDICVSWSSSKTDLDTSFLNFENRSFKNVTFFHYELFK